MTTKTINDGLNTETQNYLKLFESPSKDICTLTPTKRPLSKFVYIEIQHDSQHESRSTVALMLNVKIQNPFGHLPTP